MSWSPVLPMGTALMRGEGGELDAGGVGQWSKTPRRGSGR